MGNALEGSSEPLCSYTVGWLGNSEIWTVSGRQRHLLYYDQCSISI